MLMMIVANLICSILDIFDIPRSEIASGEDDEEEHQQSTITESSYVTAPAYQAPEQQAPATETVTPYESSGGYVQEIHREPSLQETPVSPVPVETAQEDDSITAHASGEEPTQEIAEASSTHAPVSESTQEPAPAHTADITSAPANSEAASQDSIQSDTKPSSGSPVIATQQSPSVVRPQHDQAPQGTHGSRLIYLHQQQDILSKPTPKAIVAVTPGKLEEGSEFLQSWLFQNICFL